MNPSWIVNNFGRRTMTPNAIAWTVGCVSSPRFELTAAATRLRAATICSALNAREDDPLPSSSGLSLWPMHAAIVQPDDDFVGVLSWLERLVLLHVGHEPMSFEE